MTPADPIIRRVWAMPNSNTFEIKPIKDFVNRYLSVSKVSIDAFARNSKMATWTNDLNPNTEASYHLEANDFFLLLREKGVRADLAIIDPPYSPRQTKECYNGIGVKMTKDSTLLAKTRKLWRENLLPILANDSVVLSFGWNTVGMGKTLGFELLEILLVCHGSDHNDTICLAERRITR